MILIETTAREMELRRKKVFGYALGIVLIAHIVLVMIMLS